NKADPSGSGWTVWVGPRLAASSAGQPGSARAGLRAGRGRPSEPTEAPTVRTDRPGLRPSSFEAAIWTRLPLVLRCSPRRCRLQPGILSSSVFRAFVFAMSCFSAQLLFARRLSLEWPRAALAMPASKLISSQLPNARVAENPLPAPAPHVAEDRSASVDVPAPVEDNASMANPPSELPSETSPGLDLLSRGIFNSDWRFSFRVFLFSILFHAARRR